LTIYQEETTKSEELRKGKKQLACLGYGIAKVESADKRMKNPIDFPLAVKFILYNRKERNMELLDMIVSEQLQQMNISALLFLL